MLDSQGRIFIGADLLSRTTKLQVGSVVEFYYDFDKERIILATKGNAFYTDYYFVGSHKMDKKGRVCVPLTIRNAFSNATYLPAENDGNIYILIIEYEKKSE